MPDLPEKIPNPRGQTPRTPTDQDHDKQDVARWFLQGYPIGAIQEKLDKDRPYTVSRAMVRTTLKQIRDDWRKSSLIDFNEAKNQELQRLEALEAAYWEGWRKSLEDEKVAFTGRTEGASGDDNIATWDKASETVTNRVGEKGFLDGVLECIDKRCRILGLFMPEKLEIDFIAEIAKFGFNPQDADVIIDSYATEVDKHLAAISETTPDVGGVEAQGQIYPEL